MVMSLEYNDLRSTFTKSGYSEFWYKSDDHGEMEAIMDFANPKS